MKRIFGLGLSVCCALGIATAGCGDDAGGTASSGGSSVVGGGGGNPGSQGGGGAAAGAGITNGGSILSATGYGGGTASSSTAPESLVWVMSLIQTQGQGFATFAGAAFRQYTSPTPCPVQLFGDCILSADCSSATQRVSAGTFTVTSASASTPVNVTLTPNADSTYNNEAIQVPLLGGENFQFAASGAVVPSFSASVNVPLALLIDSPTPDAEGLISVDLSKDLVLHFARGTSGVMLYVRSQDGLFECRSAPGSDTLTIPKAAFGLSRDFQVYSRGETRVTAGSMVISVVALLNAFTPDKSKPVYVGY